MSSLVVLYSIIFLGISSQTFSLNLFFKNPKDATARLQNETGTNLEDGYAEAILPHNQNTDLQFPVRRLTDLNERRLQLCIETDEKGASISFQDDTGHDVKLIGRGCGCWKPAKDTLLIEFYCIDSCLTSDTFFQYRFIWSVKKPEREDTWCDRVQQTFPSDYIVVATDPPDPITTPPPVDENHAQIYTIHTTTILFLLFVAIFAARV